MSGPGSGPSRRRAGTEVEETAEHLRLLADHIDAVVYVVDPEDGAILYVSPTFAGVFGGETPETVSEWEARVHPEDQPLFRAARERTGAGEGADAEYRIVRPDETERWIRDRSFSVQGRPGQPARVGGLAEDVTGWKRVERARGLLADTARFLSTSLEPRQILDGLSRLVVPALGDWCRIHLLTPDGTLEPAAPAHVDPGLVERVRLLDRDHPPGPGAEGGILDVARTGRPTLLAETEPQRLVGPSGDPREVALLEELGVRSVVIVPLQSRDRLLGAMTLVCGPSCREYRGDDVELARELAARAAVALDHAALLEAERLARVEAERREVASRVLARATALLTSSLDHREGLRRLAAAVVPELADVCAVVLLEDDGRLEWVAANQGDREADAFVERLGAGLDPTRNPRSVVLEALARDETILLGGADERPVAGADNPLHDLGLRSLAVVPLAARGRRIGVLLLATTHHSGRAYGESERRFLEELALRAAVAVDNAFLFRQAEEARREAEEASRAKSDFLAVMSHELRTPLNAIVGYGDLLESGVSGPVTPGQRRHLARIRVSAWHLLELIEEILSLSKIEAGRVEFEWERLDAGELAEEAVTLVRPEARRKDLPVRVEGPGEAVDLVSDRSRLRQVLVNLLSNAIKFTDAGVVVLSYENGEGETRFHVRDTGPGIAPEEQETIFEPFSRGESGEWGEGSTRSGREPGGTGLGLAVSRRFARLMGGDVTVESEPGEGSVFTIRLPRRPPRDD